MAKQISNQAHVTFSYEGATDVKTNDSNVVNSTIRDRYDFDVEKTSNVSCFKNTDRITYSVRIDNNGCGCLGSFRIEDDLGGEGYMTYVEGSARLFAGGVMTEIAPIDVSPLTFQIEKRQERGSEMVLQYTVDIANDVPVTVDSIHNRVTVTACACGDCGCDMESRNKNCVTKCAEHCLPRCQYAEVLITKGVSHENVCCVDELDYFITLTNTGNIDAQEVVVTDSLPDEFNVMSIVMENNGDVHEFTPDEYNLTPANFLTLPNLTGTRILVPSLAPGVDNTTRIRIHGHM